MNNLEALIFIDTNIYLDFYRIRKSDVSMSYLTLMDKHKDRIIIGTQIEMEFKKNRQKVILDSQGCLKKADWGSLNVPALLSELQAAKQIKKKLKELLTQKKKIDKKIKKVLANPIQNDPVYQTLQRIFKYKSPYNLDRDNEKRSEIRDLAKKRFELGCPPRKKEDNSIGDAVNWEWVIDCAKQSGKDIIIVTRDSDYGSIIEKESLLNDWLKQEFTKRVGRNQKIILTERLSVAFKAVKIFVTKKMQEEEDRIIKAYPAGMECSPSSVSASEPEMSRLVRYLKEFEGKDD